MNLVPAILAFLLLPSGHAYVRECRALPGGCESYAQQLDYAINAASIAHGVDPRLLYAVARHESSLTGRCNAVSCGMFGWHRNLYLWADCRVSGCGLDVQADLTAGLLRKLLLMCGSWDGALSAYQSGYCRTDSGVRYARRIAALAGEL